MCVPYIAPSEFWNLDDTELPALVEAVACHNRPVRELLRLNASILFNANSKKRINATELVKFPWEYTDENDGQDEELSREEMLERAERFRNLLKNI